ncbi:MAG TPA: PAS domain S-box protein [Candidatus Acidoferrales bacterium]|nr:PAS domain S-box protein [Candidatus Acidoferrales bacterium]
MPSNKESGTELSGRPTPGHTARTDPRSGPPTRIQQLERKQNELWRLTFLLLVTIALVFAWVSWDTVRSFSKFRFEALPIGLVVLVILFGVYAWRRTREISELRGLVHGLEHRTVEPPNEKQLDQLFELISRSQQGYRDLIDSFDDLLIALSLEGEVRAVNRSFTDLVHTPFVQIINHPLDEFLDDSTGSLRKAVESGLAKFLERRHWTGVVRLRLKGGTSARFFDCVIHALVKDEKVIGATVLARDITLQRESEARFTELFETLQEGIYFTTPSGAILDVNPALVRMLGYDSKEELLRVNAQQLYFDPVDREAFQKEFQTQTVVTGREVKLRKKDGRPLVCLDTASAVKDSSGQIVRYQGALLDITLRREMEAQLVQEQELARRLVDSFPDPIFVINDEGGYTFISPRVQQALGYTIEEMARMRIGVLTHPEDRPGLMEVFRNLITGAKSFDSVEHRVQNRLGEWRRFRTNATPLYDPHGKIIGVVASLRDVTDLKRLEEQLVQSEKLAAMGQMIAGVAHELNNPLTAILGVTELLRDRATDETIKKQLDLAYRQARRAAQIVQNLLDFSRPAAPQKKLLQVNNLIERTLQLQEHTLRRGQITVEFASAPNSAQVLGDANQLIQVFLNLITNAEHAIHEVRESGKIQIRIKQDEKNVAVSVQDDGVGIRPEAMAKLFDPFYTTRRPGGGTGLGLSICMAIIREHGGSIEVDSPATGGSLFQVMLPVAQQQAAVEPGDDASHRGESAVGQLADHSILVIDDEEGILEMVQAGLSAQKLRVDCALNAERALQLATENAYDVILCDVHLSGPGQTLSGEQIYEQIQSKNDGKTVFIFMTGALVGAEKAPFLEEKARCIQKPFRVSELLALLGEVLSAPPVNSVKK